MRTKMNENIYKAPLMNEFHLLPRFIFNANVFKGYFKKSLNLS